MRALALLLLMAAPVRPLAAQTSGAAVGKVLTVRGPIAPDSLGFTVPHEHLFVDFLLPDVPTGYRRVGPPPPAFVRRFQELGNIYWIPRTPEEHAFWDRPVVTADMIDRLRRG